jgi:Txe/YoeB family toxin of toxin-antitoxin system
MPYNLSYERKALKDIPKLKEAGLLTKATELIEIIKLNPYQNPPPLEKLVGNLAGKYARRINIRHRLVYEIFPDTHTIRIGSLWDHYVGVK